MPTVTGAQFLADSLAEAVKKWDWLPAHMRKNRGKRLVHDACPNSFTASPRTA
jgi:hypothetical protein